MEDYEKNLLGQMLLNDKVYFMSKVNQDDFISPSAKQIYLGYKKIINAGEKPDLLNMSNTVKSVSASIISGLTSNIPSTANWKYYQNELIKHSMKYQLNRMLDHTKNCIMSQEEPQKIISVIQKEIDKISNRSRKYDIQKVKEVIPEYVEKVEERYKKRGELPGISTGFNFLDGAILGFQKKRLIVVGARPSDGKSALMKDFAVNISMRDIPTGIISTESDTEEIVNRIFSTLTEINSQSLISGEIKQWDFGSITDAAGKLFDRPLYFYDEPNTSIDNVCTIARRMVKYQKVKIIFIDYLQNIYFPDHTMKRNLAVGIISSRLKELSRQLEIPIVVMAQLTRPPDGKPRKPRLSDLGESSKIEKDADTVIFIHHEKDKDTEKILSSQLLVRKNRDGPKKYITVEFESQLVRFRDKIHRHGG